MAPALEGLNSREDTGFAYMLCSSEFNSSLPNCSIWERPNEDATFAQGMVYLTDLLPHVEEVLKEKILQATPIRGGDIHSAFCLIDSRRRKWFLKANSAPSAALMFRREAQDLAILGAAGVIRTPKVIGQGQSKRGDAFLILEFIDSGRQTPVFWERFGRNLAAMHAQTSAFFGFAHDNYIGRLPQSNRRCSTWAEFYASERLEPQMRLARQQGFLDKTAERQLDNLCARLNDLCPEEPPALTHGDLWSGNFLCNTLEEPVLIDPAAAYAHREMDLAMSRLFGGFDPRFYTAYEEVSPLEPGFEQRQTIYQLYYLLVHVNLFGASYEASVRRILRQWS